MAWTGIDGAPGGWVAASWDGQDWRARRHRGLGPLVPVHGPTAVDIPLGLLDAPVPGGRVCDREARALLGSRRSSVFTPPTRPQLAAADWDQARTLGPLTKQAWLLVPRIREADAELRGGRRIVESHPELAFRAMTGGPLDEPKRTPAGKRARVEALAEALDLPRQRLGQRLEGLLPALRPARADDVLDALALAWQASRIASGDAVALGEGQDSRGLPMRIWS